MSFVKALFESNFSVERRALCSTGFFVFFCCDVQPALFFLLLPTEPALLFSFCAAAMLLACESSLGVWCCVGWVKSGDAPFRRRAACVLAGSFVLRYECHRWGRLRCFLSEFGVVLVCGDSYALPCTSRSSPACLLGALATRAGSVATTTSVFVSVFFNYRL